MSSSEGDTRGEFVQAGRKEYVEADQLVEDVGTSKLFCVWERGRNDALLYNLASSFFFNALILKYASLCFQLQMRMFSSLMATSHHENLLLREGLDSQSKRHAHLF